MCSNLRANTFKVLRFTDSFTMFIFFVMSILLLISYISLSEMAPELQTAANMDYITWFFLIGVCFSLIYAIICAFYIYNWFVLRTKTDHVIISELIYILGLEPSPKRLDGVGREDPPIPPLKESQSVESVYGFGHDEEKRWTFAGKKPKSQSQSTDRTSTVSSEEKVTKDSAETDVGENKGLEFDSYAK